MRRITQNKLLLLLLLATAMVNGQVLLEPFDADLNVWVPQGNWVWDNNGAADGITGTNWRERSRIQSFTEGGAALFTGVQQDAQLTSPIIDVPAGATSLFLSFYQYLRSDGGQGRVILRNGAGIQLREFDLLPPLTPSEESSSGDFRIIDLTDFVAGGITQFIVEFDVEGSLYFWLLDDIRVTVDGPARPTFPRSSGNNLTDYGIPFVVDSAGGAAVPYQLVIDFIPTATQAEKDAILQQLGAIRVQSCVCDRLELWELPGGDFFDPVSGEILGDPGDILERVLGPGSSGTIDGVDLNYYSYNEMQNELPVAAMPLTAADVSGFSVAPATAVKIAILDTGMDYNHPDLAGFVYRSDDGVGDGSDQDGNCNIDDPMGWNFVDDNNNPLDDHSHGTHIAGIIVDNLGDCEDCVFRIIPYKTHNSYGVGTLFATSCGVLQAAVMDGASVINASWGFYGGGGSILRNAIDTAGNYGAIVLAAAGNDSLNLVADQQNPATFPLDNVMGVGAYYVNDDAELVRAPFSNFNASYVDMLALGVFINSTIPGGGRSEKSGTSMATPAVAAAAALYTCENGENAVATRNYLLTTATKEPATLSLYVLDGNLLNFGELCSGEPGISRPTVSGGFGVIFDEISGEVVITSYGSFVASKVSLLNNRGGVIAEQTDVEIAKDGQIRFSLDGQPDGSYVVVVRQGDRVKVESLVKR